MPRFELLSGIHNEGGKTYYPGDVINSASNLAEHNKPNAFRFRPLPKSEADRDEGLDAMTVSQLREFAAEEEIDLGDATKKDEILRLCKGEAIAPAVA